MHILIYLLHNWIDVLIILIGFVLSLVPLFPPSVVNWKDEYVDLISKETVKQRKLNLYQVLPNLLSMVIIGLVMPLGFQGTFTLLLFIILVVDLFYNKKITNSAVTMSIIAIVALYFGRVLDSAEEIEFIHFFKWKKAKQTNVTDQQPPKT